MALQGCLSRSGGNYDLYAEAVDLGDRAHAPAETLSLRVEVLN